eukprot:10808225-Heterocapsa_arctica.AAC.1
MGGSVHATAPLEKLVHGEELLVAATSRLAGPLHNRMTASGKMESIIVALQQDGAMFPADLNSLGAL